MSRAAWRLKRRAAHFVGFVTNLRHATAGHRPPDSPLRSGLMFRRRLLVAAMLLAFALGAGYTLQFDLHEPRVTHPLAIHMATPPIPSGAEVLPGYYAQPPAAPVDPSPPRPFINGDALG